MLERIARGGGATRWFICRAPADLDAVAARLSPGSCVSFYFDQRMRREVFTAEVELQLRRIVGDANEVVICQEGLDDPELDVELVYGFDELAEYTALLGDRSVIYFGPFPGRDDDGEAAITVVLPDSDGVVRAHPH
ncbi:hypothetical protein ACFQX7_14080 [Luedemannella flava]|uniref:hypothetical protein n=1 Tax=Luedemannella flava TaxID=349316 RepID=UPI0031DEEB00